ncbi:MAG TPA: helicase HerA-like domain-containing protein [Orrella sp.]
MDNAISVGGGGASQVEPQWLGLKLANRHGLVAGATGTGKTITMQVLAESFSNAGVPVFLTDIKGDVSGMALEGQDKGWQKKRAERIELESFQFQASPVIFWDFFGEFGHPVRATVSEVGPFLLSRMLDLTEAQEGVINIAFKLSDEEGLPLLDLKDLRAMLSFLGEHRAEISRLYGNVSTASIGAIQRKLLVLENQGATPFFAEPALEFADLMRTAPDGRGYVSILHAERLMRTPQLYATFMLWFLSELFEELPEVGNPEKPVLVFFFDEAHLLFKGAPASLLEKIEQVARLIRSKGVGVYFVTQNPDDVPDSVLSQLGNRVQHALRAFTARDQQALKKAAQTYRPNPRFDIAESIRDVGVGEAITSFLQGKGEPGVAERTLIRPPGSGVGPLEATARTTIMARSPVAGKYDQMVDRDSAHEMLARRAEAAASQAQAKQEPKQEGSEATQTQDASAKPSRGGSGGSSRRGDSVIEAFFKSFARQLGTRSGRALIRGILGSLMKGR